MSDKYIRFRTEETAGPVVNDPRGHGHDVLIPRSAIEAVVLETLEGVFAEASSCTDDVKWDLETLWLIVRRRLRHMARANRTRDIPDRVTMATRLTLLWNVIIRTTEGAFDEDREELHDRFRELVDALGLDASVYQMVESEPVRRPRDVSDERIRVPVGPCSTCIVPRYGCKSCAWALMLLRHGDDANRPRDIPETVVKFDLPDPHRIIPGPTEVDVPDTVPEEPMLAVGSRETCKACYHVNPIGFHVPDDVWLAVVPECLQGRVVCVQCFARLADEKLIPWDRDIEFFPVSMATHAEPGTVVFPKPDTVPADSVRQLMDGLRVWTIRHWNDLPQNVREDWGYMVAEHYAAVAGVSFDPFPPDTGTVSAESPDTGDQADAGEDGPVKGASESDVDPDTIPAEPVRELVEAIAARQHVLHLKFGCGHPACVRTTKALLAVKAHLAGPGKPPHGTVDAHLEEQMKEPEFRAAFEAEHNTTEPCPHCQVEVRRVYAEDCLQNATCSCLACGATVPLPRARYEAEGESELRRAAGGLVRFCQEPSYARKEHRTDTMFHMQLAGLVAALKAALESKD